MAVLLGSLLKPPFVAGFYVSSIWVASKGVWETGVFHLEQLFRCHLSATWSLLIKIAFAVSASTAYSLHFALGTLIELSLNINEF